MSNEGVNLTRRRVLTGATCVVGAVGVVGAAVPFVGSWQPNAKAKAAGAPVKVDIGKIRPGEMITEAWRGKPVYILRRTPEALAMLSKAEDRLLDPQSEEAQQPTYVDPKNRAVKEEYLILVGLCTHLGCAPTYRPEVGATDLNRAGEEWLGGFFCACHGSRFDLAGRVFKGVPAPLNLVVPPHSYESDSVVVVGIDEGENA
ncbi:MAG: ubiquinol-cytochrome c reductase iron-sulfur subunit [Porticoccaceae bacterium]|nr:ubiquinol-cytochrome c reductase iron-sulfur subunit [Porticoccaceae bacterium]